MKIYFTKYNNYFNRILKKADQVSDYLTNGSAFIDNVSFNPGDGINTKQITKADYSDIYDYAVLVSGQIYNKDIACWKEGFVTNNLKVIQLIKAITGLGLNLAKSIFDSNKDKWNVGESIREDIIKAGYEILDTYNTEESIVNATSTSNEVSELVSKTFNTEQVSSRWFILDSKRLRTGQYELSLKRDTLADNYDKIVDAPVFVQKANLNENDPLICNDEGLNLNKIKISEKLLKAHDSDTGWLVGYITKNELRKGADETGDIITNIDVVDNNVPSPGITIEEIATKTGISENIITSILANKEAYSTIDEGEINFGYQGHVGPQTTYYKASIFLDNDNACKLANGANVFAWSNPVLNFEGNPTDRGINFKVWHGTDCRTMVSSAAAKTILSANEMNKLKVIFENNNIIYNNQTIKVSYNLKSSQRIQYTLPSTNTELNTVLQKYNQFAPCSIIANDTYWWITEQNYELTFTIVPSAGTYKIPFATASNRRTCSGAVYDVFAIPFGGLKLQYLTENITAISDKNLLLKFASTIATQLDKQLYDIQILPYCFLDTFVDPENNNNTNLNAFTVGKDFDWITKGTNEKASIIYWFNNSQLSYNIPTKLKVSNKKIESNTDFIRFSSPTSSAFFDMNLAKNDGLDYITVNCTFKPYNPYIQILPNFKFLYGSNYNDYRGLLVTGDFSLARINDAWVQYQLNNKNYQNIFNREISNLDISQSQQRINSIANASAGTVTGVASGALLGSAAGPWGAVAGGIVGGTAAAIGGAADIFTNETAMAEQRNYTISRFNYNLGNIKALPQTLAKVDSFVPNFKIWPFIETYSCTQEEKDLFNNKIKYDGMTVNRIGTINEFINNKGYFKGQLIRLENTEGDYHLISDIYNELVKGIYLE